MYGSSLLKRKYYTPTSQLTRPKFSTNMRLKSARTVNPNLSASGSETKMRKSKSRKYTIPTSKLGDSRRKLELFTDNAYNDAVSRLRILLNENYNPKPNNYVFDDSGDETDDRSVFSNFSRLSKHYHTPVPYVKREASMLPKANFRDPPSTELMSFIERQEDYINQLEKESQYCRNELAGLLDKVKDVVAENESLHKKQKLGLFKNVEDLDTETDEDQIKTVQKKPLEGPAIVFESRISELEAQLTKTKLDLRKAQDENQSLQRQVSDTSNVYHDQNSTAIKRQVEILQRDKETLQETIAKLQKSSLSNGNGTYEDKSQIEHARWERERSEAKLRRLQSELQRITEHSAEQARRFATEKDSMERRYTQQIDQLNTELAVQWDTASKLQMELDKQRREITDLRRELAQKSAYIDDLRKELQNKTEQSQSTAERCSLEQELANARLAADCTDRSHKQECARLTAEITSLRQRLDRADADALHTRRENLRLSEKLESLQKDLNISKMLNEDRSGSSLGYGGSESGAAKDKMPVMALPAPEKDFTSMVKNIEAKHEATVAELEGMIQSQNALMEKLTNDCQYLTVKLEESSLKHKNEIAKLQNSLKVLNSKLEQPIINSQEKHDPEIIEKIIAPESDPVKAQTYSDDPKAEATEKQDYENTYENSEKYEVQKPQSYDTNDKNSYPPEQFTDDNQYAPQSYPDQQFKVDQVQKDQAYVPEQPYIDPQPEPKYNEPEPEPEPEYVQPEPEYTEQEYNQPEQEYTQPEQDYPQQQQPIQQEYIDPQQGYIDPQQGYAEQQEYVEGQGYAQQPEYTEQPGYTDQNYPEQGYTDLQQGYTDPQQGYTEQQEYVEQPYAEEYPQEYPEQGDPTYQQPTDNNIVQ